MNRVLPKGGAVGGYQGVDIIGEVTESVHRFLLDGWDSDAPPPRIEEDLSFSPKDREQVVYLYMYKVSPNTALQNSKRFRQSRVARENDDLVYYERPPLYLNLSYLVAVHAKFHSEAERLMGWVLLRLHEASHLIYRPRRFLLPNGEAVDSNGEAWSMTPSGGDQIMEKVSLAITDDLTIGDAINFFSVHDAPFRRYTPYQARCAMEGALVALPSGTTVSQPPLEGHNDKKDESVGSNGRPRSNRPQPPTGVKKPHDLRKLEPTNREEE